MLLRSSLRHSSRPLLGDMALGLGYVGGLLTLMFGAGYGVARLAESMATSIDSMSNQNLGRTSRAESYERWSLAGFVPPPAVPASDESSEDQGNIVLTADNMPWWEQVFGGETSARRDSRSSPSNSWGQRSGLLKSEPDADDRRRRRSDDNDDEDKTKNKNQKSQPVSDTYRTVCVRMCDGYFFPISAATPRDRFKRDEKACESRCGSQAKLYVYKNNGGSPEEMQDIKGEPYVKLQTAFLYRTQYVNDCKCQAHPWEEAALVRHQSYAEAALRKKTGKHASRKDERPATQRADRSASAATPAPSTAVSAASFVAPPGPAIIRPAEAGSTPPMQQTASLDPSHVRQLGAPVVTLTPGLPSAKLANASGSVGTSLSTVIAAPIVAPNVLVAAPSDTLPAGPSTATDEAPTNAASPAKRADTAPATARIRTPKAARQPAVAQPPSDRPRRTERVIRVAQRERDDPPMRLGRGGNSDGERRSAPSRSSGSTNWRQEVFSGH